MQLRRGFSLQNCTIEKFWVIEKFCIQNQVPNAFLHLKTAWKKLWLAWLSQLCKNLNNCLMRLVWRPSKLKNVRMTPLHSLPVCVWYFTLAADLQRQTLAFLALSRTDNKAIKQGKSWQFELFLLSNTIAAWRATLTIHRLCCLPHVQHSCDDKYLFWH